MLNAVRLLLLTLLPLSCLAQNIGAKLTAGGEITGGGALTSQIISGHNSTFAASIVLSLYTITGQTSIVYTDAQNTGGLNTPTGSCGTFTAIATTTSANSQGIWYTVATSTGTCSITTGYTPATSVTLTSEGFTLPAIYGTTADGTPGTGNFAHAFHGSAFSGSSITTTVNNDLYLCFAVSSGNVWIQLNNTNAPFANSFVLATGGVAFAGGNYVQPSHGALACSWSVFNSGTTYDTAVIPIEQK